MVSFESVRDISTLIDEESHNSPYVYRKLPEREKTAKHILIESISPKRAVDLKTNIDESQFAGFPDLLSSVSLYKKAQSLVLSIEQANTAEAVEVMDSMINWIDLESKPSDDTDVAQEIKRALGIFAFRQSLKIVYESRGQIAATGTVREYALAVGQARTNELILESLVEEVPILARPSKEVMSAGKWVDEDKVLKDLENFNMVGDDKALTHQFYRFISELKKGAELSQIWEDNGLSDDRLPLSRLKVGTVLFLARLRGWYYLPQDEEVDAANPKEINVDLYNEWVYDRGLLTGLGQNCLDTDARDLIKSELDTIEDALFENQ